MSQICNELCKFSVKLTIVCLKSASDWTNKAQSALKSPSISQRTDFDAIGAWRELAKGEVETHSDSAPHPEDGIHRLGEVGPEGMKGHHAVRHAVEPQRSGDHVQVDAQTGGVGDRDVLFLVVVHRRAAGVWQLQGPGLGIVTDARSGIRSLPAQRAISHAHGGAPASPVHLPVAALGLQRGLAHHLGPTVKPLWAVGVWLRRPLQGGFGVTLRED